MSPAGLVGDFGVDPHVPRGLERFAGVSPELLAARTLQDRIDRKYLLPRRHLGALLVPLSASYRVLRSAGELAAHYETYYFDTPDREMYHEHRRGRRPRYKVRIRHHLDRRLTFLEVKRRGADERTSKARREQDFRTLTLDAPAQAFVNQHCPHEAGSLAPGVQVDFRRITLVGEVVPERLTIDYGLTIAEGGNREGWPGVVVVEIKQSRYANDSPSVAALRSVRAQERAISKYCLATARLVRVRNHVFKPELRALERLSA